MKALRFHTFGPPSVLAVEEVPMPEPGPGEVLVRVKAAGLNPADLKNISGHFHGTTLPRIPGRDGAGVVVGGTRYPGEEVWFSAPGFGISRDGVQAEYVALPEAALSRKPASLTMEQAAALGVPFITAWAALIGAANLQSGETVLIIGAAGAVGHAAVQIANWKGARVLGAVRGSRPVRGVAAIVDTTAENLSERVLALTGGKGADAVFDTVGGPLFEPALRCLRHGGRQIAITSTGDPRVTFNLVDFYHNELRLIGLDSNALSANDVGGIAEKLRPGFESGILVPPDIEAVAFENAVEGYRKLAAGGDGKKYVLTFPEG
jgi:NADPH:quinone reductase-like Zn-dependent oxidoreductase